MKRFSITQLLLFVTWCGIAFFVLARYLTKPPYQGGFHDIKGTVHYHYGLRGFRGTKFDEKVVCDSPEWDPADPNPPVSAARALSIADRLRHQRLHDTGSRNWALDNIALYPLDGKRNKWCWQVTFMAPPGRDDFAGQPPRFVAYVLMNGETVLPETYSGTDEEPADKKPHGN